MFSDLPFGGSLRSALAYRRLLARASCRRRAPSSAGSGSSRATSAACTRAPTRKLPPNGKALNIKVIGRQFIWQYVYPGASEPDGLGAPYSYEEMVVPTNTTVTLDIVSADVVHSWWVPELGGKFQAVPGLPQLHVVQDRQAGRSTAASAPCSAGAGTRA